MINVKFQYKFRNFLLISSILFFIRLYVPLILKIDPFYDETYYWYWSKFLDFGYFSKPPMVAWIIALTTKLLGNNIIGLKIGSNILFTLTSFILYKTAKELFHSDRVAFLSALIYLTLPSTSLLSLFISTDAPLSFFWILSVYTFYRFIKHPSAINTLLLGASIGFGLLSKPTMAVIFISILIFVFIHKTRYTKSIKKILFSYVMAFLIYIPNFLWNIKHNFIMFKHIKQISDIGEKKPFHPLKLLEFLSGQLVVFNPIFFPIYIIENLKIQNWKNEKTSLLLSFSFPLLVVISLQAFLEKANINWALPAYLTASILITVVLIKEKKYKLLKAGLTINVILMTILYFSPLMFKAIGKEIPYKMDIYRRVKGWKKLSFLIEKEVKKHPKFLLSFSDRKIMSQFIYHTYPHYINSAFFNPSKKITNQFCINTNMNKFKGQNFILISKYPYSLKYLHKYFRKCKLLKKIEVKIHKNYSRKAYLFICEGFKGY